MEDKYNLAVVFVLIFVTALAYPFTSLGDSWMIYGLSSYSFLVEGNYFTIITSMFTHTDVFHIFWNMCFLFLFGVFLAALIGWKKFLLIYFLGGIAGGIAWIIYPLIDISSSEVIAVGASGAVFAVISAFAAAKPDNLDNIIEKSKILRVFRAAGNTPFFFMIYNLSTGPGILGFFGVIIYFVGSTLVDILSGSSTCYAAHFGGIISGALMGYFFKYKPDKKNKKNRETEEKSYGEYMPLHDYTNNLQTIFNNPKF